VCVGVFVCAWKSRENKKKIQASVRFKIYSIDSNVDDTRDKDGKKGQTNLNRERERDRQRLAITDSLVSKERDG